MRYGLAVLVVAFVAIVGAVVLVGRMDSGSGGTPARSTSLAEFDAKDSAIITWTQAGRLVGEEQYKAVRVTITRTQRRVEILADYAGRVERSQEFPNSPEAFAAFTRALDNAKFGQERNVSQPDERGVCPLGSRFIYRLTDGGQEIMRTWSTSCSAADGPFGGRAADTTLIARLFKAQITDYNRFTSGVKL